MLERNGSSHSYNNGDGWWTQVNCIEQVATIKSRNLNSQKYMGKILFEFWLLFTFAQTQAQFEIINWFNQVVLFFFFPFRLYEETMQRMKERERLVYERRPRRLSTDWISRSTGLQTFTQCSIYTTVCLRPPQTLYTEAARLAAAGARAARHYPTIRRSPSLSFSLPSLSNRDYIE